MICIDCRYIRERPSGIGQMVREIVDRVPPAMPDQAFLLLKHPSAGRLSDAANVREVVVRYEANGPATMWWLPAVVDLGRVSVFHCPFNTLPRGLRMTTVVTIHDVMWLTNPSWAQSPGVWGHIERAFYQHGIRRALRRATHICAISEATREEIARLEPDAAHRTSVIMQSVGREFRPATQADEARIASTRERLAHGARRYVLSVGQYAGYKNHRTVVRAFARAFKDGGDVHLVLVQRLGQGSRELLPLADRLGIGSRVHITSGVSIEELVALYQGALCLCHPSLIEGFGFPLVEALASGCPVITSNRSSMPEVCGDAAEYVDPENVEDVAAALSRVSGDAQRVGELRDRGFARVQELSWERFAVGYERVYRRLIEVRDSAGRAR